MYRLAGLILLVGCTRDAAPTPPVTQSPQPTQPAPAQVAPAAAVDANALAGRVVETMDAGGYTYALLERSGGSKVWIAGPKTQLVVGAVVGATTGQAMPGFHSTTLNRTFDEIYFVSAIPVTTAMAAAATAGAIAGMVLETMDAGGYTYALLEDGTKRTWVAGPQTKLAVGARLVGLTGSLMPNFRSETLKRTFSEIYFLDGFGAPAAAAAPAAAEPAMEKIAPAPGGKTVAAVFAERTALAGKPVVVRGKIAKLTTGVLGKNWVHLRDGTGAAGSNDLMVTTQAEAPAVKIGDVVVARGTVAIDQDFGAGYSYPVLIENASLAAK